MGWLYVFIAAIFEIIGVVGLKKFTYKKSVTNLMFFSGGFSGAFIFLYISFNYLQISIAYAVWIGLGTASAVLINMLFFNESKNIVRIIGLFIIVIGVIGLKIVS
ncbi:QacE family quaternary ammonium compound efflux SMR transporter [Staphylococcus sp. 18_1_E_LY]|uniref:QacE family quaternary ammonium compound efflux SMR transporter n=1 Tax=Staphylococcus lloydii TaxID=2781774 RepID=A0A7T1F976_9STAP|nr:SMR family transporter [Staphylococcus lloydii]MBF7019590.1 QacE family quaternary ammonium compound efflux SMR transporter [Staphylococcus lloydii]MBF7027317.1 QacE family quaternary ammonium compound efflux SMR transporter [Staphylococcus lloydii]QPM74985.1 QacE family quaternary ammonium compound efflux SMR transporter [Staphylococcus lloydii]